MNIGQISSRGYKRLALSIFGCMLSSSVLLAGASCRPNAQNTPNEADFKKISLETSMKMLDIKRETGEFAGRLAWSADGKMLAVADINNRNLRIYATADGKISKNFDYAEGLSADSPIYFAGPNSIFSQYAEFGHADSTRIIAKWDTLSPRVIEQYHASRNIDISNSYAVSNDGENIAVIELKYSTNPIVEGGYSTATLKIMNGLRDTSPKSITWTDIKHRGSPASIAYSADHKHLAIGTNAGRVLVFNLSSLEIEKELKIYEDGQSSCSSIAFNRDGSQIAVGRSNLNLNRGIENYAVEVWEIKTGVRIFGIPPTGYVGSQTTIAAPVKAIAWDLTSNKLAYSNGYVFQIWNVDENNIRLISSQRAQYDATHPGAYDVKFSTRGQLAVSLNDHVLVLDSRR